MTSKTMTSMKATSKAMNSRGMRRSWLAIGVAAGCFVQGGATSVGGNIQTIKEEESETLHTIVDQGFVSPGSSNSLLVDESILNQDRRMRIARIRELAAIESNNQDFDAIFEESFEQMWRQMEGGMSMSPVRSLIDRFTIPTGVVCVMLPASVIYCHSNNANLTHTALSSPLCLNTSLNNCVCRIRQKLQ